MKIEAIATSTSLYIMRPSPTLTRERGGCAQPPLSLVRLLRKLEGDKGRSRRHLFELWEQRRKQQRSVGAPSAWHQNVLLAIDSVADDAGAHSRAGIEAPQHLSGVSIEGPQNTHRVTVEHQPAACGQDASETGDIHLNRPFEL